MYCCMASSADVPLISLQASNLASDKVEAARLLPGGVALSRLFV